MSVSNATKILSPDVTMRREGARGEPRGVCMRDRSTATRPDVKCPKCPPKADIYRQADAGTGEAGGLNIHCHLSMV